MIVLLINDTLIHIKNVKGKLVHMLWNLNSILNESSFRREVDSRPDGYHHCSSRVTTGLFLYTSKRQIVGTSHASLKWTSSWISSDLIRWSSRMFFVVLSAWRGTVARVVVAERVLRKEGSVVLAYLQFKFYI